MTWNKQGHLWYQYWRRLLLFYFFLKQLADYLKELLITHIYNLWYLYIGQYIYLYTSFDFVTKWIIPLGQDNHNIIKNSIHDYWVFDFKNL